MNESRFTPHRSRISLDTFESLDRVHINQSQRNEAGVLGIKTVPILTRRKMSDVFLLRINRIYDIRQE